MIRFGFCMIMSSDEQTNTFHHQASLGRKILAFALFLRGYPFQLYCLGNSFRKLLLITISKRGLVVKLLV